MLHQLVQGLVELLWPPRITCLLCEGALPPERGYQVAPDVCPDCWLAMSFPAGGTRCTTCCRPMTARGRQCAECAGGSPVGQVWAIGYHTGPLRDAIHQLKFCDRPGLGEPLGRRLGRFVPAGHDLVVPVPLHPARLRERGYNQAALVAAGVAAELGIAVESRHLVRLRLTERQSGLDRAERQRNLAGAFGVQPKTEQPWLGCSVLLIDDVLTTGATAAAAAQALRAGGATRVDLAVPAVSNLPVNAAPNP